MYQAFCLENHLNYLFFKIIKLTKLCRFFVVDIRKIFFYINIFIYNQYLTIFFSEVDINIFFRLCET